MSRQLTVVVNETSTGFWRLTARAFVADGWRVYATLRDMSTKNALAAEALRVDGVVPVELDVTDEISMEAAARRILEDADGADFILINLDKVSAAT